MVKDVFCILNGELAKVNNLNYAPIYAINEYEQEDIRLYNTKPLCLNSHFSNIKKRLEERGIFDIRKFSSENIGRYITKLLNVNNVYKGGVCTLFVFWQKYPLCTEPQFCIFIKPLENLDYKFNTQGIFLHFQSTNRVSTSCIPHSTYNEIIEDTTCEFDFKGLTYSTENGDYMLLKENTIHVCENLQPITRYFVDCLKQDNWQILEHPFFCEEDFCNQTEILLCNSFYGIQWVSRIYPNETKHISFGYTHAKELATKLQHIISVL